MVSSFFLNFQISRFRLKSPGFFNESIHSLTVSQISGLQFCYKQKMHPKWQHLMPYKRYLSSEKLNKSINQLLNWLHLKVFVRIILSLLKVQHKILLILPKIMSRSCRGKFGNCNIPSAFILSTYIDSTFAACISSNNPLAY